MTTPEIDSEKKYMPEKKSHKERYMKLLQITKRDPIA